MVNVAPLGSTRTVLVRSVRFPPVTRGSEVLLVPFPGILGVFLLSILFSLGPIGWFTIGSLVLGDMAIVAYVEGGEDRTATRTNCAACGAPNDADRETCRHCGDPL